MFLQINKPCILNSKIQGIRLSYTFIANIQSNMVLHIIFYRNIFIISIIITPGTPKINAVIVLNKLRLG